MLSGLGMIARNLVRTQRYASVNSTRVPLGWLLLGKQATLLRSRVVLAGAVIRVVTLAGTYVVTRAVTRTVTRGR